MFKLIRFSEANIVIGKDQPDYIPIPAYVLANDPAGTMTFKWKLNWFQRLKVLFTGVVWHEVLSFRQPLQPQRVGCDKPEYLVQLGDPEETPK